MLKLILLILVTTLYANEDSNQTSFVKIEQNYIKGFARLDSGKNTEITDYNLELMVNKETFNNNRTKFEYTYYYKNNKLLDKIETNFLKTSILNETYGTENIGIYEKITYFSDTPNEIEKEIKYGVGGFYKTKSFGYRLGAQQRDFKRVNTDGYTSTMIKTSLKYDEKLSNGIVLQETVDYDFEPNSISTGDLDNKISVGYHFNSFIGVELKNQYYIKTISKEKDTTWNSKTVFNIVLLF